MLGPQPAGFGAHLDNGNTGRVIDEHLCLGDRAGRAAQLAPFFLVDKAGAYAVRIHLCLGAEQSLYQRLSAHFEAENSHSLMFFQRHMLGDIQADAGFAETRTGRHDDQVATMQPCRHFVQFRESGLDSRHGGPAIGDFLDLLIDVADERFNRQEARSELLPGELEDHLLGALEDLLRRFFILVAARGDFIGDLNQSAERRLFFDYLRVILHVGGPREAVGETGQIGGTASALDQIGAAQFVHQGDQVDRLACARQGDHLLVDLSMAVEIEILLAQDLLHREQRFVVEQDGAEDPPLRVQIVRQCFFQAQVGGHFRLDLPRREQRTNNFLELYTAQNETTDEHR